MIFNMVGGGGGSGATLVVSSPANVSVTVSKGDKSYTKNSGSLGSTTFKGLATGIWTVTISGNGQTATKTIEITADYAITIAFFSATISITYPANSNCVVTNSSGQTVASDTNTGTSAKTWTATVNATGTYTVTATATDGSGKSKSQSVSITTDGQSESVTLNYSLLLYSPTGDWESYVGGYASNDQASVSESNNQLVFLLKQNPYGENAVYNIEVYTNNPVDLTEYATATIALRTEHFNGYVSNLYIGFSKSQTGSLLAKYSLGDSTPDNANNLSKTITIDVSSLSGSYYFGVRGNAGLDGQKKLKINSAEVS